MLKAAITVLLTAIGFTALSQTDKLGEFEKERIQKQKNAVITLGGISAVSVIGNAFATKTNNVEQRYFHQMNVMWGSGNMLIAGLGYLAAGKEDVANPTLASVIKHQNKTEKIYLINTGLDVLYMAGGLYLKERSGRQSNPAKFTGYGNAVLVQGGFLFVFDAVNYLIHRKHGKKMNAISNNLNISAGAGAIAVNYRF